MSKALSLPNASTCTEWSITRSTGTSGLIFFGSEPRSSIASRIAARSTTAGTPVKSCMKTRAGWYGISFEGSALASQLAIVSTSFGGHGLAVLQAQRVLEQRPSVNTGAARRRTCPEARQDGRSRTRFQKPREWPWHRRNRSNRSCVQATHPEHLVTCCPQVARPRSGNGSLASAWRHQGALWPRLRAPSLRSRWYPLPTRKRSRPRASCRRARAATSRSPVSRAEPGHPT